MFASLKKWINVPVELKHFVSRDGAGDASYEEAITLLTYPVSEVVVVRNAKGTEVTSDRQLYVDGSVYVTADDLITFEGEELLIKAIRTFYRDGVPDLKVVYL